LQPPKHRHRRPYAYQDLDQTMDQERGGIGEFLPYVFGGVMLVAAFAFAGHQLGRNAIANTAPDAVVEVPTATVDVAQKGSLLLENDSFAAMGLRDLRRQTVTPDGKGDLALLDLGEAPTVEAEAPVVDPVPVLKPTRKIAKIAEKHLNIEPAAVNLGEDADDKAKKRALKKLALAPKSDDIESEFKLSKA
jgi:hypothetical protein